LRDLVDPARVTPSSKSRLPVTSATTRSTIAVTDRHDVRISTAVADPDACPASQALVSSNGRVNLAPGRAHGTATTTTP